MSWLSRLRRTFGGRTPAHARVDEAAPSAAVARPDAPGTLELPAKAYCATLIAAAALGKRLDEIGGVECMRQLEQLWTSGHERATLEWFEKFMALPGLAETARLRLQAAAVERYAGRGEMSDALHHAQELTTAPAYALRAHVLLAEHYLRTGDDRAALAHYEAVLAHDVQYPNAMTRVQRLRQALGHQAPVAGATLAAGDLRGGEQGGRYRPIAELGRGAAGAVYLARDTELGREVALKLLHPHFSGPARAQAVDAFFREARTMAALRHPNIVAVLDLDAPARRIVMELGAGGTLRELLRTRGPQLPRRAIERHVQLLAALVAAHAQSVVHRDVKPGNLLFRRDPDLPGVEMMLGDFGVAHLPQAQATQGAMGTLAYMAPEQRRGEVSPAVDVYAAGVVLWEALTGALPWPATAIWPRDPAMLPVPAALGDVPHELRTATLRHLYALLAEAPSARPSSADAFTAARALRTQWLGAAKPRSS